MGGYKERVGKVGGMVARFGRRYGIGYGRGYRERL